MDQRHYLYGWQRASRCSNGACIEVADAGEGNLVRDSKESHGPILTFGRRQWQEFLAAVRSDEFTAN